MATCGVLGVGVEALPAGCSVPDLDETGKTCTGDRCPSGLPCVQGRCGGSPGDAGLPADAAPSCTPPDGGDPCVSIPRLNGVQTVDCDPREFCDVPVWVLDAPSGGSAPAVVRLQVAWSDAGLHLFASVAKWPVSPSTNIDLYTGDAIEVFVAASSASLQGGQGDDSAHFVAAPSPPNAAAGGVGIFYQPSEGPMTYPAPSGIFAACVIPDAGYNVEVQMPWGLSWLPPTSPPAAGDTIGFDFAVDVAGFADAGRIQTFEYVGTAPDSGATNQCALIGQPEAPYCDDRSCCSPRVQ